MVTKLRILLVALALAAAGAAPATASAPPAACGQIARCAAIRAGEEPDSAFCPIIALFEGEYFLILVNSQGDVYVFGLGDEPWWDCPPYDIPPGS